MQASSLAGVGSNVIYLDPGVGDRNPIYVVAYNKRVPEI
jgi:hypothetical protein